MLADIKWGMIGAGDVTEVKSGPAFKKVEHSDLVAVMRRNEAKVKDYAARHGIARWYTDAKSLLADNEIDAVYIATPPNTHLTYALMALRAGKAVYLEKPMTLDTSEALQLAQAVKTLDGRLSVAHYRRQQPYFKKVKSLIAAGAIGTPRLVSLKLGKRPLSESTLHDPKMQWRLDPEQSGGGLFHDLAPHQIDFIYHLFGNIAHASGFALNQSKLSKADDMVSGQVLFENQVLFNGTWAFNLAEEIDRCEIFGSEGKLVFSFFDYTPIALINGEGPQQFALERLQHVQQPMIEAVVSYFQGERDNPCTVEEGVEVMRVMDVFTGTG
ncbi:Gfo/Idh/MocA family oxidoreductase [Olivibacter sp. SDN3]|uniref:Gfo/Idh/MocA family protein n=1 Tax=Olivibacter sp. SDN3 TaxID=2764720 RepID=UPI0016519C48|nr:Gfo/Idh/MocA family oxidoreductase [Olivibacter sp. SDN3]QNL50601.1 Gfo/Idh/MocA family oxidoreductase [Olivibacter sp. SDN3]